MPASIYPDQVLLVTGCVVLGLVIGSFLNVVAWRVPRGESVVSPGSHCPACDAPVRVRDNLPVLGWVLLRGRCRDCGSPISVRYPAVELVTAVVFGLLAWRIGLQVELPAFLYLGGVGIALALIDLDVKRLPNSLTLPSYAVGATLLGIAAVADSDAAAYIRALLGMLTLFAFYFLLAFIYPAGMGFGDVKLAGVLGMHLGWLGWGVLAVGGFLGFLLGGLVGGALMMAKRAGRKTAIPFGPFMLLGALLAILWGHDIAAAYTRTLTG